MIKTIDYYLKLKKEFIETIAFLVGQENLLIYDKLKEILKFKIHKPEYSHVRDEIIMCLLHKFNQAAITLTNHYLEKHLKYLLIDYKSGIKHITNLIDDNQKFADAVRLYGGASMGKNIDSLFDLGLIDESKKDKLTTFKNKFRNPYSHSDFRGIFKQESAHLSYFSFSDQKNSRSTIVEIANALFLHGEAQKAIADKEALDYFLEVDRMVCQYEIGRHPYLLDANGFNPYPSN